MSDERKLIIGLTGPAGCGKSTVAAILQQALGGERYSFATPLKQMLEAGFGLTDADKHTDKAECIYGRSMRYMMQTLGTEWGRDWICENVWVRAAEANTSPGLTIIDDVRFPDEAEFVRMKGILIHIERPKLTKIAESDHISETGIELLKGDDILINGEGIEDLRYYLEEYQAPHLKSRLKL